MAGQVTCCLGDAPRRVPEAAGHRPAGHRRARRAHPTRPPNTRTG